MKSLPIARGLALPLDVVTEKLAFLGQSGSGKTYAAGKMVELMLDVGAQVVILTILVAAYPRRISREDLCNQALGAVATGGSTFSGYLSALRTNGLITEDSFGLQASDTFFAASAA